MKNKKTFIITEGGQNIGFGHISRCSSLYRSLKEQAYNPEFIINGDDSINDLLKGIKHIKFNWIEDKETLFSLLKNQGSDITIIDSYLAGIEIYKNISEIVKVPVFLDDNKRIHYPRGIVLNWSLYAENLQYPNIEGVSYLLGTEFLSLRKAFDIVPVKKIKVKIGTIMVTMGGDDSKNLIPDILKLLKKILPDVKKIVIIGRSFMNVNNIKKLSDRNTELIYSPDDEGMKKAMFLSDLAVTSGGQTLFELARVGLPSIAVAVAENQMNNVKAWEKLGFIKSAGFWNDINLINNISDRLQEFISMDIRLKYSKTGQKETALNGNNNLISEIENKLNEYNHNRM